MRCAELRDALERTSAAHNAQRDHALRLLRDQGWEGVVYNMDDDNGYHPRLWPALRAVGPGRAGWGRGMLCFDTVVQKGMDDSAAWTVSP